MADDASKSKPLHPAHGWGKLAENPWLQIGSDSAAHRAVLRRYWLRNGGDDALFDRLIPPPASEGQADAGK